MKKSLFSITFSLILLVSLGLGGIIYAEQPGQKPEQANPPKGKPELVEMLKGEVKNAKGKNVKVLVNKEVREELSVKQIKKMVEDDVKFQPNAGQIIIWEVSEPAMTPEEIKQRDAENIRKAKEEIRNHSHE